MTKGISLERRQARAGFWFVFPFLLGFILFFLQPMVMSLYYSLSDVYFSAEGLVSTWVGIQNYRTLFMEDVDFLPKLVANIQEVCLQVPVILLLSIFISVILNQKFRGRTFCRAIFFLPVLISSGIIISIMNEDVFNQSIQSGGAQSAYMLQTTGLSNLLYDLKLPSGVISTLESVTSGVFDTLWKTGVQILIFLAAMQSIPYQLYEVSKIEGATAWESFWKVTFPYVSPMILVATVYTIVDGFTDYTNSLIRFIQNVAFTQVRYSYACAMAWVFAVVILVLLAVVCAVISKITFYQND